MEARRSDRTEEFRTAAGLIALVWGFGHSLDFLFQLAAGLPALQVLRADLPLILAQYLLSLLLFPIVIWSERRPALIRWGVLAFGVTVIAGAMVGVVLVNMIGNGRMPSTTATDFGRLRDWLAQSMIVPIYIYITGFIAAVLVFARSRRFIAEQRERLLAAEAAAAQAQLLALRLQVNPHFLFNSLNAVSALIVSGRPEDADDAVTQLSDFLRASLAADPTSSITLEEEIAATEAYLRIEGVRFPDRLCVAVECPDALLGAAVPNLILQPLAENAIKYGVSASSDMTIVTIRAEAQGETLCLSVSDNAVATPGDLPSPGTGIGLANIRQRLHLLFGAQGSLSVEALAPGYRALIRLPLSLECKDS